MEAIQIKKADSKVFYTNNTMFFPNFTLELASPGFGITTQSAGTQIKLEFHEPITIEKEKIEIDSEKLENEKFYKFCYLGTEMVLQKSADGKITFYEVNE